jgi:hypothetical protein
MNKHKLTVLASFAFIMIAGTACRKADTQHEASPAALAASTEKSIKWNSVSDWNSSKQDKFTIHYGKIQDSTISASVASKGLVLVFKKNGTAVNALPFDETGTKNAFWYYQVSEGTILINSDVYGSDQSLDKSSSFQHFIISENQLKDLEAQGHSKLELMGLSYEKASSLLN